VGPSQVLLLPLHSVKTPKVCLSPDWKKVSCKVGSRERSLDLGSGERHVDSGRENKTN
jgi:hypothetical protein